MKSNMNAASFAYLSSFEILAQPIVPNVPGVPYVTQGYFFQATNLGTNAANFSINYIASTDWAASGGGAALAINTIDGSGNVNPIPYDSFIDSDPVIGSVALTVPGLQTVLIGVQLIPTTNQNLVGPTPQDGASYRGYSTLIADSGSSWLTLATHRQVFTNFNQDGSTSLSEAAYAVPVANGPLIQL